MISLGVRFVRNQGVVARKIQGELIIVPIRRGVGDLVARVCDEFDVTASQAQRDIEAFLDSLVQEQLVESVA